MLGVDLERSRRLQRHFPADPVPAAVLVALVDRPEGLSVLLTQRASQLTNHAAQISFPGGRLTRIPMPTAGAALREAQEEIGLDPARVRVFGYLPDHLVFWLSCDAGAVAVTPPIALVPNPAESPRCLRCRGHVFEAITRRACGAWATKDMLLYDIPWQGQNIWGATAGMLLTLVRMVQEQPE